LPEYADDTKPTLSARQAAIPQAATMAAAARARALRADGRDIISLTLGEPDFPTPLHAIEAAHEAALRGETKYPAVGGTPALKSAIRAKFLRDSRLEFTPEEILVGNGARQIIYDALTATLDAGDEIIVPAPYWNAYPLIARMAGAQPVFVDCPAPSAPHTIYALSPTSCAPSRMCGSCPTTCMSISSMTAAKTPPWPLLPPTWRTACSPSAVSRKPMP
jgi:aspartate/methionine/tyrosine aminotransferase